MANDDDRETVKREAEGAREQQLLRGLLKSEAKTVAAPNSEAEDALLRGLLKAQPAAAPQPDAAPAPYAPTDMLPDPNSPRVDPVPQSAMSRGIQGAVQGYFPVASMAAKVVADPMVQRGIRNLPAQYGSDVAKSFMGGADLAGSGLKDIYQGVPLPYVQFTNPETRGNWGAGGILKSITGAAGMALSPFTAGVEQGEHALEQITGNPEFAHRAGIVGNSFLPIGPVTSKIGPLTAKGRAAESLVNEVGPADLATIRQRLNDNPRLSLMDVSPKARNAAQGLAVTPTSPRAQQHMMDVYEARKASAPEAMRAEYATALGMPQDAYDIMTGLTKSIREVGQKAIEPAVKNARPVNVHGVINQIDDTLRKGGIVTNLESGVTAANPRLPMPMGPFQHRLIELRNQLHDGENVLADPQRLHELQSAIRVEAEGLKHTDGRLSKELFGLRDKIVGAIDDASPKAADGSGTYRAGLTKYREANEVEDAFLKGTTILQARAGEKGVMEDSPGAWKAFMKTATDSEKEAVAQGAAWAIRRQVKDYQSVARGVKIPEGEIFDKLAHVVGEGPAKKLQERMRDLRDEALTNHMLFEGSQTAARTASGDRWKVNLPTTYGQASQALLTPGIAEAVMWPATGYPGIGAGVMSAAALGRMAASRFGVAQQRARNLEAARMLTATGPEAVGVTNKLSDVIAPTSWLKPAPIDYFLPRNNPNQPNQ